MTLPETLVRAPVPQGKAAERAAAARRASLALLHYTGSPVVGGVEAVMDTHARLFAGAGYPTRVVVGRGDSADLYGIASVTIVPEMDSEWAVPVLPDAATGGEWASLEFLAMRDRLEEALSPVLRPADVVIVHNVLTTHFNLPLTAALHRLADRGLAQHLIVWCHDISRYVNPQSGAEQRTGYPWDLLRHYRPDFTYVAVSAQRQRALANILGCPPSRIRVVPNGVDPALLLGLSSAGAQFAERLGLLAADMVLLMPCRITQAKNIEFSLQVTAALKSAGVQARLVITGPPDPHSAARADYYGQLRELCRNLALEREVAFVHEFLSETAWPQGLPPAIVAELLRIADLVLMPSHREGFGIPVLEAGLVGRPVFATAIPVVEELGAGLVELIGRDETPQSVADRIRRLAEQDPAWRLRRRVRQTYAWSTIFGRDIEPLVSPVVATQEGAGA